MKTETKVSHTPGPWKIVKCLDDAGNEMRSIQKDEGQRDDIDLSVCGVWMPDDRHLYQVREANAKLIAAAPDLLKALQGLALYFEFMVKDPGFKEYVDAIEAIKKATQ